MMYPLRRGIIENYVLFRREFKQHPELVCLIIELCAGVLDI